MTTKTSKKNHKHTWSLPEGAQDNDIIICENCGINMDEWETNMLEKGYTHQQLKRFQNE